MTEAKKILLIGREPEDLPHLMDIADDLCVDLIPASSPDVDTMDGGEIVELVLLWLDEIDANGIDGWCKAIKARYTDATFIFCCDTDEAGVDCALAHGALNVWSSDLSEKRLRFLLNNLACKIFDRARLRRENGKLSQVNQRLKTVVGNVAHDLRGPFSKLINISDVLQEGADPSDLEALYQIMARTSQRGFDLVNNLLDLSVIENDGLVLNQADVGLEPLVDQVLAEIEHLAVEKEVKLNNQVSADVIVTADAQRLTQVLINLVNNAVKFTPSGGSVSVAAEAVADGILVQVRDTGVGMDAETVEGLFQISGPRKSRRGTDGERGTGLGLAISQEIIKAHQSLIQVASERNGGSVFSFTLPSQAL